MMPLLYFINEPLVLNLKKLSFENGIANCVKVIFMNYLNDVIFIPIKASPKRAFIPAAICDKNDKMDKITGI